MNIVIKIAERFECFTLSHFIFKTVLVYDQPTFATPQFL